ncbi:hypothetical protein [Nocardia acidivorans]|nr:hypothetical protein [Nocardia acidivorans]
MRQTVYVSAARAAQLGELTASDPPGRVSASAGTDLDTPPLSWRIFP